jgi:type III pantothenate kinase
VLQMVADLGNSRLKWARADENGHLADRVALELDAEAWATAWAQSRILCAGPSSWTVSSVNPPVADKFAEFLESKQVARVTWYRAASEISVPFDVEGADTGGADRALAVFAALRLMPAGRPGLVVSCGTAITVERVTSLGVWQGGAIAPGLGTVAAALHLRTAQLPLIDVRQFHAHHPPSAWGRGTVPSLQAGIFWGTVGAVRELLARQGDDLPGDHWVVWTGGDAAILAPYVSGRDARIEPDLVLIGLSHMAVAPDERGL